jgi:hypothetical protein
MRRRAARCGAVLCWLCCCCGCAALHVGGARARAARRGGCHARVAPPRESPVLPFAFRSVRRRPRRLFLISHEPLRRSRAALRGRRLRAPAAVLGWADRAACARACRATASCSIFRAPCRAGGAAVLARGAHAQRCARAARRVVVLQPRGAAAAAAAARATPTAVHAAAAETDAALRSAAAAPLLLPPLLAAARGMRLPRSRARCCCGCASRRKRCAEEQRRSE